MTSTTPRPDTTARAENRGGAPRPIPQYSLGRMLGVWAAAALPMAGLAWVVAPWLASVLRGPAAWPQAILLSLTAGLMWQFVLVLILIRREQGTLRWAALKHALWLQAPRSPKTGRKGGVLWLLVIPMILLVYGRELLPKLPAPAGRDLGEFLQSVTGQEFFAGNWTWFALALVMFLFNTVLGEELLFRGLLLPRMHGVFGRVDWLANGVLFALYHLHVPWAIPGRLVNAFILSWPARRYRSALLAIIAHTSQSIVFAVLLLLLVLK